MKAVICETLGPLDGLRFGELPDPVVTPGHLLVEVAVAGVNFPDGLVVEGKHVFKPQPPFVPGAESAGTVLAVGEGVEGFAVGDRVVSISTTGAFGEKLITPAETTYHVPPGVPFDIAAASLITHATSYHALKDRARLQPGETVLVLGAAGGTGLAAVEIAKAMGATVIAAASTPEKMDLAKKHGADRVINYSEGTLKELIRDGLGIHNVDVVYDPVGGPMAEQATRLLAWGGRYLVIGFAQGEIPKLPINLFLVKQADLLGVLWGLAATKDQKLHRANMAQIFAWFGEGKLTSPIGGRYPLERAIDALGDVMGRRAMGKLVVEVAP
jgi:NADPH:quinone reductase